MRAYSSRTAWLLIVLAATAGSVVPLRADQRGPARPAPSGSVRGTVDPLASFPPPDLPPAVPRIATDVTGSIRKPEAPVGPTGNDGLVPALSLEAGPVAAAGFNPPGGSRREPNPPAPATAADAPLPSSGFGALASAIATFAATRPDRDTPDQWSERRRIRADIAAFYAARGNAPLWFADGHLTPAARSVLERLDRAAEDGLDLRGFAVPVPRDTDADGLARTELALSEAAVAYGRQATGSRVDVARLGGIIDMRPAVAEAATVLALVPGAPNAGDALRDFNPPQPGYAALRDTLAALRRRAAPEARDVLPPGPAGHADAGDARVPLVRARFGLGPVTADDPAGRTRVAAAGAPLQRIATASDGPMTSGGGNPQRLESALVANMEEWRWLPRDLGPDRIEVNIPDFEVRVMRDGIVAHQARVVVGKPDRPTPVFSQVMTFIIVNPYWNVPLSIINKEMMPKLAANPNYFQDHGYEVVERNGITTVRQPPGDDNALGRIKFMFPNSHSVYLHDTNARSFFGRDKRALSHGCVRVDRPFAFAEAVLGRQNGWTEARVQKLVGGTERVVNLPEPLPIHIVYFTAFVDPKTGFQLRDDVYGTMGRIEKALAPQG